jgi:hypothetical protein
MTRRTAAQAARATGPTPSDPEGSRTTHRGADGQGDAEKKWDPPSAHRDPLLSMGPISCTSTSGSLPADGVPTQGPALSSTSAARSADSLGTGTRTARSSTHGGETVCPACLREHKASAPCHAGPSRVEPALYAEAAVRHHLELIWGDLSHDEVARMVRLSDEFIRLLRSGARRPSKGLLNAIGFEQVIFYRRKQ